MANDAFRQPIVDGIQEELSRKKKRGTQRGALWRFPPAVFALLFAVTASAVNASSEETYDFRPDLKPDSFQQVQAVVEVRGDLLVEGGDGERQKMPIVVSGKVTYDERLLAAQDGGTRRSVRHYREAAAEVKVGQGLVTPQLNPQRRLLVAQIEDGEATLFSPLGPLTRDDLELVDIQGNSLALSGLLPRQAVRVGESWELDGGLLAILLGLDTITRNDVRGTLEPLDGSTAVLTIEGSLEGAAEGVVSKIELKAKLNFDLTRRAVTWLAANFRERREISHGEPGFDVTARLRLAIAPQTNAETLSDQALRALPLSATAGATLLQLSPQKSFFRLIHDRRWRVMLDRHDLCVLRCVDRGDLLAQGNISELADAEPGKRLALEGFQAEVLDSLASSAGQIAEASQETSDDGLRILRVQATGITSEIPIVWIFYHLSNEQGRQAAMSFTLASDAQQRFAEGDRTLVESFEFTPRPQPQEAKRTDRASPAPRS